MTKRISLIRHFVSPRERERENISIRIVSLPIVNRARFSLSGPFQVHGFEPIAVSYRSPIHDSLANRDRCRNRRECQDWKSRMESMEFGREKRPSVMLVPFVERNEASRKRDAVAIVEWGGRIPREVEFIECYGNNRTFVRLPSDL